MARSKPKGGEEKHNRTQSEYRLQNEAKKAKVEEDVRRKVPGHQIRSSEVAGSKHYQRGTVPSVVSQHRPYKKGKREMENVHRLHHTK